MPIFRPDASVVANVDALIDQCKRVIVIEDGPGTDSRVLRSLAQAGAEVISLPRNSGIGFALNVGVQRALEDPRIEYVLTVDQDSRISANYVAGALELVSDHVRDGIGLVVPAIVGDSFVITRDAALGDDIIPLEPIQSGMFIPRSTFVRIGLFRAELFIDGVDADFFQRVRRADLKTLMCERCSIEHQLGEVRRAIPGRAQWSFHSPVRRFYMTRNRLVVLSEYGASDPAWRRAIARNELRALALTLAFGSQRWQHLVAVLAGIRAFRRGRLGPIPSELERRLNRGPRMG